MDEIIQVKDLVFSYPNNTVLRSVNMTLNRGEFAAIVGTNGAGKSTLIKVLLSELPDYQGSVQLFGQSHKKNQANTKIGYVPQIGLENKNSFPATAGEIVGTNLYSQLKGFKFLTSTLKEKIDQTLDLVGMLDFKDNLFGELSGGQKRRVLLARSLVAEPELLLLDEPTAGVDSESSQSFYTLLSKLNKEKNLTILIITHNLDRIYPYLDKTYCLEEGYLVELSKDQVQTELSHKHPHPPLERRT